MAGIVEAELECIPYQLESKISNSDKFVTYSMGSGSGCDGHYLFASDLLGSHNGHYSHHSIRRENLFDKSVEVLKRFIEE